MILTPDTKQSDGTAEPTIIDVWLERSRAMSIGEPVLAAITNNLQGMVLDERRALDDLSAIAEREPEDDDDAAG